MARAILLGLISLFSASIGERAYFNHYRADFAARLTLSDARDVKGSEPEAYLDSPIHFPHSKLRETAHPASKAALINGVEMAEMDNRWSRQAGFLWGNLNSHRKSSYSKVARNSRHNSQPARSVPHIILDNQRRMGSSHFTSPSHREINEINFPPPWQFHLAVPPSAPTGQCLNRQGEECFRQLAVPFIDFSINLVGRPDHLTLSGFLESPLDGLANEGASRQANFLRQTVDLRDKRFGQA
jgi:hypothetical protein